jgi:hypothetical protein
VEGEFKVKCRTVEEYNDRLKEFTNLLDRWTDNEKGRYFTIDGNLENLTFKIKASYGEN